MTRVLLDTDILSEILKQRTPSVIRRAQAYLAAHGRFTLSSISAMEISYGLHRMQRERQLQAFEESLGDAEVLAFDADSALLAGRIEAELEIRGTPVDLGDVMIASVALNAGLPVVTGNTVHFASIQRTGNGLVIDNWRN